MFAFKAEGVGRKEKGTSWEESKSPGQSSSEPLPLLGRLCKGEVFNREVGGGRLGWVTGELIKSGYFTESDYFHLLLIILARGSFSTKAANRARKEN